MTDELLTELSAVPLLASLSREQLHCLEPVHVLQLGSGDVLARVDEIADSFWILLDGEVEVLDVQTDGKEFAKHFFIKGEAFGEVSLLANIPNTSTLRSRGRSRLLRLDENGFWRLMTACPEVRQAILRNMAMRLQKMQHYAVQQEKMAGLGMLAAGLMHELNNPGAAARRATSQLRQNFFRLQELSRNFSQLTLNDEQRSCVAALHEQALHATPKLHLNSIEQSDAEDALCEWMEAANIPNAWKVAPSLAAVGVTASDMTCAQEELPPGTFVDAVEWIDATISSMQLINTIEESIGRVTELVKAVKSYAYEGSGQLHSVDLNESIHGTLVILGHKIREKQIVLRKEFGAGLAPLRCGCKGLNQIWTNLLDNAIDAVPAGGQISIKTWSETKEGGGELCILISDNGEGIRPEAQARIFDPFFTTKEPGVGTGLGLGIVSKLVQQNLGVLHFASQPGKTEFLVRLPVDQPSTAQPGTAQPS